MLGENHSSDRGNDSPLTVAVADGSGNIIGVGFLVSQVHVITCSHVVRDSLKRSNINIGDSVTIVVSGDENSIPISATVQKIASDNLEHLSSDVAILKLPEAVSNFDRMRYKYVHVEVPSQQVFSAFGFPDGSQISPRRIVGDNIDNLSVEGFDARGLVQLRANRKSVTAGFSGAPVRSGNKIAGMLVSARQGGREAFMIPSALLHKHGGDFFHDGVKQIGGSSIQSSSRGHKIEYQSTLLVIALLLFSISVYLGNLWNPWSNVEDLTKGAINFALSSIFVGMVISSFEFRRPILTSIQITFPTPLLAFVFTSTVKKAFAGGFSGETILAIQLLFYAFLSLVYGLLSPIGAVIGIAMKSALQKHISYRTVPTAMLNDLIGLHGLITATTGIVSLIILYLFNTHK